ncbi:hypothetical protein DESPIG_02873 [Desulfovibrio piger ATCC 29098]|uniref:Uncharacterized protein n=1 Tax=Desulfovibrio piger ATCC 29098 TaxID=411464 RepID=B6WXP6_9BACT|nr:hypothetical protein DESPIG_02873 [Desulfovibrio piger ATCC 29098]
MDGTLAYRSRTGPAKGEAFLKIHCVGTNRYIPRQNMMYTRHGLIGVIPIFHGKKS